jgi:hypothetical protein
LFQQKVYYKILTNSHLYIFQIKGKVSKVNSKKKIFLSEKNAEGAVEPVTHFGNALNKEM